VDDETCRYTGPGIGAWGQDLPEREYNWGEWRGVDGPVLICVAHGWPGWGTVYDHLDDDSTEGVPCQAKEDPRA
jgi:hypothetical protein